MTYTHINLTIYSFKILQTNTLLMFAPYPSPCSPNFSVQQVPLVTSLGIQHCFHRFATLHPTALIQNLIHQSRWKLSPNIDIAHGHINCPLIMKLSTARTCPLPKKLPLDNEIAPRERNCPLT